MSTIGSTLLSAAASGAPIIVSIAGQPIMFDSSFKLGIICTVSNGASLNYKVQVTGDANPSPGGNWNDHDTLFNLAASANGNIDYPVNAVMLVCNSRVSGSVNMTVNIWP